jgi:type I restriction enzyme S subunit
MNELYELPEGWEWKKLEDVFLIARGGSPRPIKDYITDSKDGINWIKIGDATRGDGKYIEFTQQKIKPEGLQKSRLVEEGDFIMSNSMSFGRPYIMKTKGAIHDGWLLMRSKYEDVDKEFFYHLLSSNYMYQQFKAKASGTTVKNLNIGLVKTTNIPLPPLQEQKRIVAKLDTLFAKIDQAIALHQQNIDEAEGFMGSVLNEVFEELEGEYESKPLGELTKTTSGGTPRRDEKSYWGGTIGWLKSGELNNGYVTEVQEFITEEGLQKSSAKLFPKGTLLIAMYGATVGKLAILDIETTTNQAICGVLNDKQLFETKYMFYFFQKSKEKMLLDSTGGAQPNISQTYLKLLPIVYPPLKTQQKTVQYLDQLSQKTETLKQVQTQKMESLKALKASLLDRAFRGEI